MEPGPRPDEPACSATPWPPRWLEPLLIPDARFARAYNALGDRRRALIKRAIAAQFALHPPSTAARSEFRQVLPSGLEVTLRVSPRPFTLVLCDSGLDAPAMLLAALMPTFAGRPDQVLVVRLGARSDVPQAMLAACELAGQERVAALGPRQMERLLLAAAQSGLPGLVLHQHSPALRRILDSKALRAALDASPLSIEPLALPLAPGIWRDAPGQINPEDVDLLYGALEFEAGDAARDSLDAFAAGRGLLILPDSRAGQRTFADCAVCESRLGLFTWPQLVPDLFTVRRCTYSSAP
jgi:hypothetical protein